ncbi:MAG TPA: hypothetical protein VLG74_12050, partial [Blastocatellia bacterium]|nr:hypothetical protein [Blastocatellia bacterium]
LLGAHCICDIANAYPSLLSKLIALIHRGLITDFSLRCRCFMRIESAQNSLRSGTLLSKTETAYSALSRYTYDRKNVKEAAAGNL